MIRRLSRSLKGLGRSIGRRSRFSIARQSLKDKAIRKKLLEYIGTDIQKELTGMCTVKDQSKFWVQSKADLEHFSWDEAVRELETRAPTLYSLLKHSIIVKSRRRFQTGGRKTHRPRDTSVLGVLAGLMLQHRSQRMNVLQRLVSLILHRGHAEKQVNSVTVSYYIVILVIVHTPSIPLSMQKSKLHVHMFVEIFVGVSTFAETAVVLVSSANKCLPWEAW